ncbi:MAG: hypothetical protein WC637_10350 [Victivallales bacterium]|jgi:hypothetical protein
MHTEEMKKYRVRIAGFGLPDEFVQNYRGSIDLEIKRKGQIHNKRTGSKYDENIIAIEEHTTYEKGFEEAIDRLISLIKTEPRVSGLFDKCSYIELQVWVRLDDENRVPNIHLSPSQVDFLSKMKAHIDVDII